MKLSKDELLQKVAEKITDEDISIELMEDISDSMGADAGAEDEEKTKLAEDLATVTASLEEATAKIEELKKKYKDRFLSGGDDRIDEEIEDIEENKIIDVKEI